MLTFTDGSKYHIPKLTISGTSLQNDLKHAHSRISSEGPSNYHLTVSCMMTLRL